MFYKNSKVSNSSITAGAAGGPGGSCDCSVCGWRWNMQSL